ncbi:hypothetical protein Aduo_005051 [Ancylostoma duodenale]
MILADSLGVCQKTVSNAIKEFVTALNHPAIVDEFLSCESKTLVLQVTMCLKPEKAAKVVMECAVLHNIMIAMQCRPMRRLGRRLAQVAHPPQYI